MVETKRKDAGKVKALVVPCEVYSRVVGYYRPVSNWNIGKKQEFKERRYVKVTGFDKGL